MEEYNTSWSKPQLKAYILLYCAHADFTESKEEKALILSKISGGSYGNIHQEFDADNDYQSIQKILSSLSRLGYSSENIEQLITEIRALFFSDGEFNILEKNLMMGLSRLLRQ